MSTQPDIPYALDPFGSLRAMRDANLESWSKMMIDLVNSDEYSQATSQWLDTYVTMSQPLQRIIDMTMTQVLTGLNMPLRTDVTSLAERLTNIEMRLDDQDAKLDNILSALQALSAANHAEDASVVTPTRSDNGAKATRATHSVGAKDNDTGVSHTSQTRSAQKKAKGDH
jgi:hypothetical protein